MKWIIVIAALAAGVLDQPSRLPLDEPLSATTLTVYAPADELTRPSDASELGLLTRVARVAEIPFGFEADETAPRPTTGNAVRPHDFSVATLRAALDVFIAMDSRYEWRDVNGVLVIRTRAAWLDRGRPLNAPVRAIKWDDVDVVTAFNRIARLLYPDGAHDPFEGLATPQSRTFSLDLPSGTILDLLDAVARADGQIGWALIYGPPGSAKRVTLTIGHYGNGPSFGWPALPSPVR